MPRLLLLWFSSERLREGLGNIQLRARHGEADCRFLGPFETRRTYGILYTSGTYFCIFSKPDK